jgi:uncharacterized membrane protein
VPVRRKSRTIFLSIWSVLQHTISLWRPTFINLLWYQVGVLAHLVNIVHVCVRVLVSVGVWFLQYKLLKQENFSTLIRKHFYPAPTDVIFVFPGVDLTFHT